MLKHLSLPVPGSGFLVALSLLGLAGCGNPFIHPLPANPPHDIVIEYEFSPGMTTEWLYIAVTPGEIVYRFSNRDATESLALPLDKDQFETFYRTIRALHPETLHSVSRPSLAHDHASTGVRIHAASIRYSSRADQGGALTVPAEQAQRFAKIVDSIRKTARGVVDAARRPVNVCIDAGKETAVTYLSIGGHLVENLQDKPSCTRVALLDRQRYTVTLLFREKNSVATRSATGSFVLEPDTQELTFVRKHDRLQELHRRPPPP